MGARRVDPDEAVANIRAAGLEPLEPYPGKITAAACAGIIDNLDGHDEAGQ